METTQVMEMEIGRTQGLSEVKEKIEGLVRRAKQFLFFGGGEDIGKARQNRLGSRRDHLRCAKPVKFSVVLSSVTVCSWVVRDDDASRWGLATRWRAKRGMERGRLTKPYSTLHKSRFPHSRSS